MNLQTFLTVARMLSFHRAAESLNFAQSTVSSRIKALEEEVGVPLFERLGRRILLTEAGERLVEYARKMLDLEQEALAEVASGSRRRGSLTIRVPESFCIHRLPPVIRAFRDLLPCVSLHFVTCAVESLSRDLQKGVTDIAFLMAESVQEADLTTEVVGIDSLVLVASPDHPLSGREIVRTTDLEGETLLLSRVDCSYRREFERLLTEESVKPEIILEFNSVAAIKQCVKAGLGITVAPGFAVKEEFEAGTLEALRWAEEIEVATLMIRHRDKWLSPNLSAFIRTVRETLASAEGSPCDLGQTR